MACWRWWLSAYTHSLLFLLLSAGSTQYIAAFMCLFGVRLNYCLLQLLLCYKMRPTNLLTAAKLTVQFYVLFVHNDLNCLRANFVATATHFHLSFTYIYIYFSRVTWGTFFAHSFHFLLDFYRNIYYYRIEWKKKIQNDLWRSKNYHTKFITFAKLKSWKIEKWIISNDGKYTIDRPTIVWSKLLCVEIQEQKTNYRLLSVEFAIAFILKTFNWSAMLISFVRSFARLILLSDTFHVVERLELSIKNTKITILISNNHF